MEHLLHIDRELFMWVNGLGAQMPFLDGFMLFLSSKWGAIPLYALLCAVLYRVYGLRGFLWIAIGAVCTVILTDQGSVRLFKEVVQRLRPCHEPLLEHSVRLVQDSCGGMYGFVSSHAANTFGVAAFAFVLLRRWPVQASLLFLWAGTVGLSRIYLGVHYPGDVLVGALFGTAIGLSMAAAVRKKAAAA